MLDCLHTSQSQSTATMTWRNGPTGNVVPFHWTFVTDPENSPTFSTTWISQRSRHRHNPLLDEQTVGSWCWKPWDMPSADATRSRTKLLRKYFMFHHHVCTWNPQQGAVILYNLQDKVSKISLYFNPVSPLNVTRDFSNGGDFCTAAQESVVAVATKPELSSSPMATKWWFVTSLLLFNGEQRE